MTYNECATFAKPPWCASDILQFHLYKNSPAYMFAWPSSSEVHVWIFINFWWHFELFKGHS